MKKKCTYLTHKVLIGILFFMVVFVFWPHFQAESLADSSVAFDIKAFDGVTGKESIVTGSRYIMWNTTQTLQVGATNGDYISATWTVASGTSIASITNLPQKGMCRINALKPGVATIAVEIKYENANGTTVTTSLACQVEIKFGILGNVDRGYGLAIPTDERPSLVLKKGDTRLDNIPLSLNYGAPTDANCTWSSDNEDVVKVDKGVVTVVGAGRTQVRATYRPDDSTDFLTDTITVYVVPSIKKNGSTSTSNEIYLHSESEADKLFSDAVFTINSGAIKDKIEWEISTGRSNTVFIEDSIGTASSDLIELEASTPKESLRTVGKAGEYTVRFFPKGLYEGWLKSGKSMNDIPQDYMNVIHLHIYGEFEDKTLYVDKGDSFDIAQAFNLTKESFKSMFDTTLESGSNVVTYVSSNLYGTADEVGDAIIQVKIKDTTLVGQLAVNALPSDGIYTIRIHVSDGIKLDRTSVTLALGASLQLRETSGTSDGVFTWESSSPTQVSVDDSGLIKGLQITGDNNDVKITLTQITTSGYVKRAVCLVRVVSTVTNIKLNYEKVNLEVDKTITVKATFTPDISTAPITWITNEKDIVDISPASDNKSVVITGKKPGVAVVSAINKDNFVTASVTVTVMAPIKSIKLNETNLTVKLNQEVVKLKASYEPSDATSTDLIWASSNTSVATVDDDGVVTLVSAGTALITVRPAYNPYLTMAQCNLTVLQSATGFSLSTTQLTLEAGQSAKIDYKMVPASATTTVIWKSMNTAIASVSSSGRVTGVGPGKTYIVATTDNGFSATCEVVVTRAATGVTLDVYNLKIAVGDTYQVLATPNPKNSTETTFTWKSKDSSIATVNSSGKVTGVKPGETIITVKTKSGSVEYLYVTVYNQITSMKLNYTKKTLVKGKKFTLKTIFTPANATNKKVKWASSNTKVASVTSKGVVSGLRGGVAVITAVSEDGGHAASCLVTVKQPVSSVTLNKSSYTLGIGKTLKLKATVKSTYSSNQRLKWTSSNIRVATVSSKGIVKGKRVGTAIIRCKTTDGSGESATCKIRVVRQATKITLNKTTIKMLVDSTTKIKARVTPKNASYKTVKWSSSDSEIAQIDSNGNITALAVGNCKIYARAKDNSGKKAVCYVYVKKRVPSTSVNLSQKDMTLVKGTSSMLPYSITPNNTTDTVRFYSDNKRVATVSSTGRVTARKPGAATITIKTSSGKVGMVNITVVGLNRTSVTMGQYERVELWVEEISNGVKWYSEDASIASVDNGSVVSRTKGKTRIVAMINGIRLYCKVTVY